MIELILLNVCSAQKKRCITHLLFECIVAKIVWNRISEYFQFNVGSNYESVARFWITGKILHSDVEVCTM